MIKNKSHFNKTIKYEKELLAQVMYEPGLFSECLLKGLTSDMFNDPGFREIFSIMGVLYNSEKEITYPNINAHISGENRKAIADIIEPQTNTMNPDYFMACIKNGHEISMLAIKLIEISSKLTTHDLGKPITDVKHDLRILVDDVQKAQEREIMPRKTSELIHDYLLDIEDRIIGKKSVGIPSGFPRLDKITGGFQNTSLYILAARPGVGKTAMALNFAQSALSMAKNVLFFSLEMSSSQLINRLAANASKISQSLIYRGDLTTDQQDQLVEGIRQINNDNLMIDDDPKQSFEMIISKCRLIKELKGLDFIIIDYLTLMRSSRQFKDKRLEIEEFTFMLKNTAKSLNVPILCLAQLNRGIEGRKNKTPVLSDLKESGSIEQDADVVLFISSDDERTYLTAAKNRHGQTGDIVLNSDLATNTFWEA